MKTKINKKGQRLSTIMIGMVFTIGIVILMFTWIGDAITQYSITPPSNYNASFYAVQGISGNLTQNLNTTYQELQNINSNTGGVTQVVDFVGFFFNAAYRGAISALASVGGIFTLVDTSISGLPIGPSAGTIKGLFWFAILIIAIIAILMKYVFKVDT